MSSATPVAGTPGAVSAESLLEKYNLPEGTNADAIARVMARLGDLPVSSAEKPRGDPAGGDPGAARSGGARVDASARRNQMRFTSGGEPVARVSWSPASPGGTARKSNGRHAGPDSPTTPGGDPLALIQDLYGDDVEETVRASARRALTAAGYGSPVLARASPARASPAGRASALPPRRSRIRERGAPEIRERRCDVHLQETDAADLEGDHGANSASSGTRRARRRNARGARNARCGARSRSWRSSRRSALRSRASVRRSPRG